MAPLLEQEPQRVFWFRTLTRLGANPWRLAKRWVISGSSTLAKQRIISSAVSRVAEPVSLESEDDGLGI